MPNAIDSEIKRMAEFLRQGAKMLSENCPECNNPLFKLKNSDVYCPSCQKRVIREKTEEIKKTSKNSNENHIKKGLPLAENLKRKLEELDEKLSRETDIQTIIGILKAIRLILKILVDLQKNQGLV